MISDDTMLQVVLWQHAGDDDPSLAVTPDEIAIVFNLPRPWYLAPGQDWEWSFIAQVIEHERRFKHGPHGPPNPPAPKLFKHGPLPEVPRAARDGRGRMPVLSTVHFL